MNPFEAILKGADKIINGELPFAPKTANSTSPTAFKVAPASEILNPKPTPAPKPSIFTTKTPAQQVAEVNAGIKNGTIKTPTTNVQKTPDFSSGIPVLRGGEIKPATGKEVKPTKIGDFMSGLFGEAQKIVGGDPFERAEVKDIEKRTGLQQPFFESIRSEGLLPSLGKTESEKMQSRYESLFESGINSQRAKEIAIADVLRNKIDLKNPTQDNRKIYDSLKVTPEEEKAMRWTKVWEVAQLGLDTIGNIPALGSLKFLRNTGKVIAETDDVAKITSELLETGMPENVARKVAPDFVKITDEKKVAQRIEDIATALKADPKAFGEKIVKQYPDTVTQIAKLNDPKAIEEILYTTGVERSQIPAMAKVLSNTDNPKRVTNIIEGFTKIPGEKKAEDFLSEARKFKTAEEFITAKTGGKFGKINKIDLNSPKEEAFFSQFADGFLKTKSPASGLTYSTIDKIGSLNTALKQKGFKGVNSKDFKGVYSLDKIIENPALFAKYPKLKEINVVFADFHTPTQRGVNINNDIFLNSKLYSQDPTNIESTLIHEIEHSIQDIEGKIPKFSQFEEGRQMTGKEYQVDLREEGARKKQQEYLDNVKTRKELEDTWKKSQMKPETTTPIESERVQNVLRTKTPEEISNIQNIVSKEKNLVDINTTKFDNVIEDANANRPESYQEILEGWSRGEFKPIEAVKRADGTLFIEDGRHRLLLAQEMGISKYPIKITRNEAKKTPLEVVLSGPSKQKISEVEEKIAKIDEDEFYTSMDLENERNALDTLKEDVSNIDLTMYKRLQAQGLDLESGANRGFIKDKRTGKMKKMRSESFNTVARQLEDLSVELGRKGKEGYIGDAIEMVDDYIARESAYRQQKKIVSERMAMLKSEKRALQKEISQVQKSEIQAVESKIKEEKFLNQQAEKTQKMIEEEKIAKIKAENRAIKNEEIKKQLEETQKRLIEEKAYKQRYKEIVSMANRPEFSNSTLGNRLRYAFRKTLFPIKNLDEKTQTIFRDWKRQILVTRELANEQFAKLAIPKEQGMKIINDFQAGRKTEYTDAIKKVFDDLFKQAKEKGFDFRYRENYLPQVYKETPAEIREKLEKYFADQGLDEKMIQDYLDGVIELPEEVMRTLKLNPSFEKQRTFPTYEIAKKYGLTPKYENPAQLASHYKEQMEIALANKNFIKKLEAEGKVLPEADAPRTWDEIKLKLDGGRYFAKPEFAEIINGQLREADKLGVFDLAVKGVAKTSKLMQEIALSAGVPKSSFNFFSIGQAVKALTTGDVKMAGEVLLRSNFNKASIKFFQENADVIKEMASEGVDVSKRIGDYKDMYESLVDKLSRKEYREAVGVGFSDLFNEKTFSSFMPQMQISNYKQVYAKAIKDGMTPEQARAFSADVTRKFFGLFEDVGRSDATNDGLTALFFAPRFREGMINVLMNNLKSVTTELRNPIYYKNRRLVVGMTLTYAMYNAINKELNGNYMWENEPGKEFALKMPYGNGQFVYLEFMPSFLAFARSLASGFYNLGTGNTGVATQKLGSVFSMPIKTTTDIISNSDYFDRPIYKESDEGTVKAEKIAKYAGLSFAHPYVKELIKQIDEKNKVPLWQSLSIAMELPLKYSNQQKINTAKYYENLNNFNKQNAQIKDRNQKEFQPTFDKVQKLKEEGKIEEAKAIVDALSDYEYDFYKTMLKSVKAKETNTKKVEILPLYEQVQQLKDQGRIEEASEIVDSLSEEDYKAYSSLKKSFSTKPEISVSDN